MPSRRFPSHHHFDLRQLRTFLAVAELGSISKASERLLTAQPALSRQLHLLEQAFGVQLVQRHGRGVAVTSAGEELREHVWRLMDSIDQMRTEVTAAAGRVTGHVALGMVPTVGMVLGTPLAQRFIATYPEATLQVAEDMGGYLLERLRQGRLDLAVVYNPRSHRDLRVTPLLLEGLWLVGPPSSKLRASSPVTFRSVARLPLVLPGVGHGLRHLVDDSALTAGLALQAPIEADSFRIQKELVTRGVGHTILPFAAVHAEVRQGLLVAAPIEEPRLERNLVLASPAERPASPASRRLREMLIEELLSAVESGVWPDATLLPGAVRRAP